MATYNLTSTTPAKIQTGDILNCPYSGSYKTITLPAGTYKLEVWGAMGGYRSSATYAGKGGYSVGTLTLTDKSTEKWQISSVNTTWQNHNGTNTGQTYTKTIELLRFEFKSGATITIPEMTGKCHRYAPAKTCNESKINFYCYYVYNNTTTKKYLINSKNTIAKHSTRDPRQEVKTNTSKQEFQATSDGYLVFEYYYNIHLSTYNLLGTDKASVTLTFNTGKTNATVSYPSLNKGTSIGPNGFRCITNEGCMISYLEDEIKLLSPNKKYGLKITDKGVYYRKNSNDETSWTEL
jgi:hypothetical protein